MVNYAIALDNVPRGMVGMSLRRPRYVVYLCYHSSSWRKPRWEPGKRKPLTAFHVAQSPEGGQVGMFLFVFSRNWGVHRLLSNRRASFLGKEKSNFGNFSHHHDISCFCSITFRRRAYCQGKKKYMKSESRFLPNTTSSPVYTSDCISGIGPS